MQTISDLTTLLASMEPVLTDGEYLFCTVSVDKRSKLTVSPVLEFQEPEGIALVLLKDDAERLNISGQFASRMIRLNVYSSLDAVGFLAAITAQLAANGISVQPVSAFYHDHLFVPEKRANESMKILNDLVRQARDNPTKAT